MLSGTGEAIKKKEIHNVLGSDEKYREKIKQGKEEKECQIRRVAFLFISSGNFID